jgi:hypothetical protein
LIRTPSRADTHKKEQSDFVTLVRQKNFQIRALGEILKRNLFAAVKLRNSGYVPVAIAPSEPEALEMSKLIEAKLKNLRAHRGDSSDTLD